MQSPDVNNDAVEAIKKLLFERVRSRITSNQMLVFKDRPELQQQALERLTADTLVIMVQQIPPITLGTPCIMMAVDATEKGKCDGILLKIYSDDEKDALWEDVTPEDFAVLCEYCALKNIEYYENLLKSPPEELDRDFNGSHTYRSLYTMELTWAKETLAWVKGQSPQDLKTRITYC